MPRKGCWKKQKWDNYCDLCDVGSVFKMGRIRESGNLMTITNEYGLFVEKVGQL